MSQTGSYEFFNNYAELALQIQPDYYAEIRRIMDGKFQNFVSRYDRKPVVLDIGSAGLLPYDVALVENVVIFDLFKKPDTIQLDPVCIWITGDIVSGDSPPKILEGMKFDFIIISSVLHHLCNDHNEIIRNMENCFNHSRLLLADNGTICIFESTCPAFLTPIEDFLYPLYSRILIRLLNFSFVRMVSLPEILNALQKSGLRSEILPFRQPRHILQLYWRVPTRFSPLVINGICATPKEGIG